MTDSSTCNGDAQRLQHLAARADDCLARDVPGLLRQVRALQRRCRRGQPVDRGIARLEQALREAQSRVDRRRSGLPVPDFPPALPVVERRDDILAAIEAHQVVVLCGETGSGKTTQLPKLCLSLGRGTRGKIGHTQPRRLAARSLAARIAEELHCVPGSHAGYKVRFQDRVQDSSYIKVMTDGVLLAEIHSDPELREYDTLILDEAHERSLNIDFLLGYLHRLLPRRPDLKLVITSATIDPQRFASHFNNAPVIEVSGRSWPVEVRYRPPLGDDDDQRQRNREQAIVDAVDEVAAEGPGDILVFLAGERAIRDTSEQLRKHHPPQTEILALYARLSADQQNRVFQPHTGRRIILATNVAETSLTVPGIRYVVDTGLARISRYDYRTKVQRLPVEPVSQASAKQRAGRCGRVAAGVCIRLYSEDDYLARDQFTPAEIRRTNLASVILQMATQGLGDIEAFPFIDVPDPRYVRDGFKLLQELGAVDDGRAVTPLGCRLARLPIDPRLARMLLAAHENGCLSEVLIIVAVLESADPRERPLEHAQAADEKHALFADSRSDFLAYLNLWKAFGERARHLSQNKMRKWCREHFVSWLRMREWIDIHRQLQAQVHDMGLASNREPADYRAIHTAMLTGLLGNVAVQVEPDQYLGARNLKFTLFPGSGAGKKKPKWVVAAELVETGRRYLRTVAAVEPGWLESLAVHLVKRTYSEPHWEKKSARVIAFERVTLYGLPLVQRRRVDFGCIDPVVSRDLFIRQALVLGQWRVRDAFAAHNRALLEELEQLEARSRRRDLVAGEEQLYAFFDERIPAVVVDAASFRRWWKKTEPQRPDLLHLPRQLVMQHSASTVTEQQFPDRVTVRGVSLPVSYRFAPGNAKDGLCVRVPLAALNQLRTEDFDWLVPGMLREKCILLIKSLPKPLRRHFVPAPDLADACLRASDGAGGSLTEFLQAQLQRMTGVKVSADAWRPELLPAHFSACFELDDEHGQRLAEGRDLVALQQRFGGRARQDFRAASDARYQRRDLQDWDFGSLPEVVELERDGVRLHAYPALSLADGRIDLSLFDLESVARKAHGEGLLALFRKRAGRLVKDIRRSIPDFDKQALWFSTVAGAGILQADLERAVLQAAFLLPDASIRDAESFRQRLERGSRHLLGLAVEIGDHSYQALQAYRQVRQRLKGNLAPQLLEAVGDVREQVERLIYPGFVSGTPAQWLPHLARYLRAAERRLEQLPSNPGRDREHARLVDSYWQRYRQALERGLEGEELTRFRWLIEELRVSLFAQSLGTAEKISPQRLDRLWQKICG
ncbi:MAG: ATP-dependent RNA helicase HrpA [Thiogranum sp.]